MFVGAHLKNWDRDGDAMAAGARFGEDFQEAACTRSPEKGLSELEKHPKYVGKSNKTFGIPSSKRKAT